MGCKQCKNPVCKPQLSLILYNLGIAETRFKPMLYDFQGRFDFKPGCNQKLNI